MLLEAISYHHHLTWPSPNKKDGENPSRTRRRNRGRKLQ